MNFKKNVLLAVIISCLCGATVFAATAGTTAAQVLELQPSARAAGMGGTFCAIADDAYAVHYNPAGLANVMYTEIPVTSYQWLGMSHQFFGLAYNMRDVYTANVQDLGTIAVFGTLLNKGTVTTRDIGGLATGSLTPKDNIVTLGYGKPLMRNENYGTLAVGLAGKFVQEDFGGLKVSGQALDAGVYWGDTMQTISFGAAVQNLGSKIGYVDRQFDLPMNIKVGGALRLMGNDLLLGADYNEPRSGSAGFNLGGEYWFMKTLAFRAGYDSRNDIGSGLTLGVGLSLKQLDVAFFFAREVSIDYAFIPSDTADSTSMLSLVLKLGAE